MTPASRTFESGDFRGTLLDRIVSGCQGLALLHVSVNLGAYGLGELVRSGALFDGHKFASTVHFIVEFHPHAPWTQMSASARLAGLAGLAGLALFGAGPRVRRADDAFLVQKVHGVLAFKSSPVSGGVLAL